ncbi:arf-GAP with GTPase, ANK repeat and PH domain-containing protein 2-like [Chroicocephalus ridibundus]|uniref:arf-GAP with GTPase, ANK repeat and PH domain-containing protein 2-like n=1 Tax=Chroicocephalus ridibundus TaxID=1192867 RepID=UPI002FDDF010
MGGGCHNAEGTASTRLRLRVHYPPAIVWARDPVVVAEGDSAELVCEARGSPLPPGCLRWGRLAEEGAEAEELPPELRPEGGLPVGRLRVLGGARRELGEPTSVGWTRGCPPPPAPSSASSSAMAPSWRRSRRRSRCRCSSLIGRTRRSCGAAPGGCRGCGCTGSVRASPCPPTRPGSRSTNGARGPGPAASSPSSTSPWTAPASATSSTASTGTSTAPPGPAPTAIGARIPTGSRSKTAPSAPSSASPRTPWAPSGAASASSWPVGGH